MESVSQSAERGKLLRAALWSFLKERKPDLIIKGSPSSKTWRVGVDGTVFHIQVDGWAWKTGFWFMETLHNSTRRVPGWALLSPCPWALMASPHEGCIASGGWELLKVNLPLLREAFKKEKWKRELVEKSVGNAGYRTVGVLLSKTQYGKMEAESEL